MTRRHGIGQSRNPQVANKSAIPRSDISLGPSMCLPKFTSEFGFIVLLHRRTHSDKMTEVENKAPEVTPEIETPADQPAATEGAKEEQPAEAKTNGEKCKKKGSGFKGWMKNLTSHVKISTRGDKKAKSEAAANGKEEKADEKKEEDEAPKTEAKPEEHKDGEQSQPQEEAEQE
ncbi:unnamed protein product [Hymenolepis diminuta]|uniref:Prothymosin alpha-like n=2 Tax=Hymenolepis diminuta TaxID=6216 RepID=A0A0R3SA98_HYMDI|nr:unnamed protein product [Hymenolepis diminuta]